MALSDEALRPRTSKHGKRVVSGYLGEELAQRLDNLVLALQVTHPEARVTRSSVLQTALRHYLDAVEAEGLLPDQP